VRTGRLRLDTGPDPRADRGHFPPRTGDLSPNPGDSRYSTPGTGLERYADSTPVLNRYTAEGGTGRIGYNDTPQLPRRASLQRSPREGAYAGTNLSPIPRSVSAFDNRTPPRHQPPPDWYDGRQQGLRQDEEEPVYVPRSVMTDIIYQKDDELYQGRSNRQDLIELPSGARQRKGRILSEGGMRTAGSDGADGVRQRKGAAKGGEEPAREKTTKKEDGGDASKNVPDEKAAARGFLLTGANTVLGLVVMVLLSYKFSYYLHQLHDNELWFSEILELEREISFRTEQGLYYSYYKQLVAAPSLAAGMKDLQNDNMTESGNTINILHRFNIYQEVFLAYAYKFYNFRLTPIFFYTYFIFGLQGFYLSALYLLSWSLSGTWVSGVLTAIFVVANRFDVTRVTFTVPLREHFSLPFIFAQFGSVGQYLKSSPARNDDLLPLAKVYLLTLLFTVTWQFAQFVLLLQAVTLFGLATVGLLDRDRVCRLLTVDLFAMLTVWYLQFYQQMVINSLVVSLIPVAILSLQSQADNPSSGLIKNLFYSIMRVVIAGSVTLAINIILKVSMNQTADSHIFKFVKSKLVKDSPDFETNLYLCNEAFKWLDLETYRRLSSNGSLPLYLLYTSFCLGSCISSFVSRWRSPPAPPAPPSVPPAPAPAGASCANGAVPGMPGRTSSRAQIYQQKMAVAGDTAKTDKTKTASSQEHAAWFYDMEKRPDLCFHIGQTIPFCLLAVSTLRMKCFWSPYICILASVGLADSHLWSLVMKKVPFANAGNKRTLQNMFRHLLLILFILLLGTSQKSKIDKELEDLREFYDPDTVDLMQWLEQNTKPTDAISGSMQLMAGVKLCSNRPVTNHPHFEDKDLRDRTKDLYQMYAKVSPAEVHQQIVKHKGSYIILEDSICLAHRERCSLPDIMDISNGHIPDDGIRQPPHLVESKYQRFCDEVRYDMKEYRRWFKKVFENKTFRVYKVL